eukprot:TRINITY_DN11849_c0_g1_i1.p1 TRINITY_DN11849_c0_g1~~TRINITY_DN11849_c0_g1_i1.p1  ORF type:complete len:108 (-),score=17.32 TRINITY_DN11849_c0_g1_i1:465-788(-)
MVSRQRSYVPVNVEDGDISPFTDSSDEAEQAMINFSRNIHDTQEIGKTQDLSKERLHKYIRGNNYEAVCDWFGGSDLPDNPLLDERMPLDDPRRDLLIYSIIEDMQR